MIAAESMAASTSFSSLTVNAMVDKAELNNPSELSAIKTLCEKMRPNLLGAEVQLDTCLPPSARRSLDTVVPVERRIKYKLRTAERTDRKHSSTSPHL
ncbi:hypothetical protein Q8A67_022440 [Cirrhinus molitorella]|uniref:Uncharacterized protein n=1 Tax=Cirrhinus molitorella TaxID=172907 RepID=A0AA88PFP0_9TELE|nr:hypothetical protein Q8A67_022440 [Cirrhinus molitorella]